MEETPTTVLSRNRKRNWLITAILFLGILATACGGAAQSTGGDGETPTGSGLKPAPDFTINLYRGQGTLSLADLRGKPVVVNFWGSWCPPCRAEMPDLQKVFQQFEDQGLVIVGIAVQDTERDATDFADEVGVTYPIGPDDTGQTVIDYGVIGFPTSFFITRDGEMFKKWGGAINEKRLLEFVQEIL